MQKWECIRSSECPDTSQYKGKTEAEPSEVKEAREGKPLDRVKSTPPRPWCPLWWLPGFVAPLRFGVLRCFALGHGVFLSLGYFGPLCKILFILMAHTSLAWIHLKHFSPKLGLNHRNLQ